MSSLVDFFLNWWLRKGRYPWSRLRRSLFEGKYLQQELPKVASLEDVEACVKQVTWAMDGPFHLYDSISYPQMVWAKKKDDCDGFAVLAAALLRQWQPGSNPVLMTVMLRPVRRSHTVCVFSAPGAGFWFFDNDTLRREDCQTYADVVAWVRRETRLVCWDIARPDRLQTLEFHTA